MRRLLALALALAGASTLAVGGCSEDDGGGEAYRVRAIFDNAVSVIPGEDVKIAGVNVGKIESLDVTPDQKAAVVLRIDEPGFRDFRQDASCIIRPQSLIGEKFVECAPTEPKGAGEPPAPPLRKLEGGPGEGQHLLPVANTTTPVDLDLINNVFRLPYAQRFQLILNELGTGLAARGRELNQAIRRANPALRETDRVLAILAKQNRVLADLARDSDVILAPLARDRAKVADFVVGANETAQATAERRSALEADLERLPTFLRELRPTMARLGSLADQMTPVLRDLGRVAPDLNRFVGELGPFSGAALPALRSLGTAADVGSEALPPTRPLFEDLRTFAKPARPVASNLDAILQSFQRTGGIERLLDYIFYQVAAINGFDAFGRYLRANLIVNTCSTYAVAPVGGCTANFLQPEATGAYAQRGRDKALVAADKVLRGKTPKRALEETGIPSVQEAYGDGRAPEVLDYLLGDDG